MNTTELLSSTPNNIYDKQNKVTWLRGILVRVTQTPKGTQYTNQSGEAKIIVFAPKSGEPPTLSINGEIDR